MITPVAVREMDRQIRAIADAIPHDPIGAARDIRDLVDIMDDWRTTLAEHRSESWRCAMFVYELSAADLAREMGVSPVRVRQVIKENQPS